MKSLLSRRVNNLTHADLTDGSDLDFAYDAAGRRLEKKYTRVINNVTYETKYTYHYIGSQITTIDISGKEDETITKNDQMRIHLGANSRPISFEYYTDIGTEQQASETYYYHYDLHGNVIRVTDDTGTTEITYTYDSLGTILTEVNPNSIYNPFTWSGEAQVIHDPEFNTSAASPKTGLYNSGSGYYNPETGTFLSGTGAPATTNPTSASAEEPTAQETKPANQLGLHAAIAAVAGGVPVSAAPATSSDVTPEPTTETTPIIGIYGGDIELTAGMIWGVDFSGRQLTETDDEYNDRIARSQERDWELQEIAKRSRQAWIEKNKKVKTEGGKIIEYYIDDEGNEVIISIRNIMPEVKLDYNSLPDEVKKLLRKEYCIDHPELGLDPVSDASCIDDTLQKELEFVLWTGDGEGTRLVCYKTKGSCPVFFDWNTGQRMDFSPLNNTNYFGRLGVLLSQGLMQFLNLTGKNISIILQQPVNDNPNDQMDGFKIFIPSQDNPIQRLYGGHLDLPRGLGGPSDLPGDLFNEKAGYCTIVVGYGDGTYERFNGITGEMTHKGEFNCDGYFFNRLFFNNELSGAPTLEEIQYKPIKDKNGKIVGHIRLVP